MEPEAAGSCLDITIGAELTALKRTAEEFNILQYHMRSMRIMISESAHTFVDNMSVVLDNTNH
eukprot:13655895-Ditylum_brightwellii.AAC.1